MYGLVLLSSHTHKHKRAIEKSQIGQKFNLAVILRLQTTTNRKNIVLFFSLYYETNAPTKRRRKERVVEKKRLTQNENGCRIEGKKLRVSYTTISTYS